MDLHEPTTGTLCLDLPLWVRDLFADAEFLGAAHGVEVSSSGDAALCTCQVEHAESLDAGAFRLAVTQAYGAIHEALAGMRACHPLRYWNFIPAIHEPMGAGLDRYKVFNLGRYDEFAPRFARDGSLGGRLPTATGIGHESEHLVIHCLAGESTPVNLENPRQVPAYQYSSMYGPRPPCFARGGRVRIRGEELLLVGGTSSVRGEESVRRGDLVGQLGETLENIGALMGSLTCSGASMDSLRSARAYVTRQADRPVVEELVRRAMPNLRGLEVLRARICREELLVEVEGVALVSPR